MTRAIPKILLATVLLGSAAGGLVSAQARNKAPDGLPVGRWFLTPYFQLGYEVDDNVFRRNASSTVESDRITTFTGGLGAVLPIRNSLFRLAYEATFYDYEKITVSRDVSQQLDAAFELRFASGDRLTVSNAYDRGFADVQQIDEGGELVFNGEPYDYNRLELELRRDERGRQGYLIRVAKLDLAYQDDAVPIFFDYSGFEAAYEYRQPVSGHRWLTVYHDSRRVNHYDPNDPGRFGVPFRKEESDTYQIGLRGFWAKGQPFFFRVGYGEFRYARVASSDYAGLVGAGRLRLNVGSRSTLDLGLQRRTLPSNFDTYYLIEHVTLDYERVWMPAASWGLSARIGRNRYADPIAVSGCDGVRRDDDLKQVEAFVDWALHSRYGVRVAANHVRRDSNCGLAGYDANVVSVGMHWGWN